MPLLAEITKAGNPLLVESPRLEPLANITKKLTHSAGLRCLPSFYIHVEYQVNNQRR